MKNIHSEILQKILRDLFVFLLFPLESLLLRTIGTVQYNFTYHRHVLLIGAGVFLVVWWAWDRSFCMFAFFNTLSLVAALSVYSKKLSGYFLNGAEVSDAFVTSVLMAACLFLAVRLVYALCGNREKFLKTVWGVFFFLFLIPAFCLWGYSLVNHDIPSLDVALSIFQTNPGEVFSFVMIQPVFQTITIAVALALLSYICFKAAAVAVSFGRGHRGISLGVLIGIIFMCYAGVRFTKECNHFYAVRLIREITESLESMDAFRNASRRKNEILKRMPSDLGGDDGVYVLVIGESATRNHMHICGYRRENTPFLERMVSENRAFFFPNAYSCHVQTVPVLTYALTQKNQYNAIDLKEAFSISDIVKNSGYDTWWLSNQNRYGVHSTPVSVIASGCSNQAWVSNNKNKSWTLSDDDAALLDVLPENPGSGRVFIVLHLMGSHWRYSLRYPEKFDIFKDGDRHVAMYDNTIAYTDDVLRRIYEKVKGYNGFKAMMYFSDHGEEADLNVGHDASKFTWQMARIPFFVILSDSFKKEHPAMTRALKNNKDCFWTNDLVYNLMLNLMGISAPGLEGEEHLNLASSEYDMTPEVLRTLHRRKKISEDPLLTQENGK